MTQATERARKLQALMAMAEVTPGPELSEAGIMIWLRMLERFSAAQVEAAIMGRLEGSHFRPTPADVIAAIEGSAQDRSLRAWHAALDALHSIGTYHSVDLGDAAAHYAIDRMGGWQEFGQWNEEDRPFRERQFRELYEAYNPATDGDRRLLGRVAVQNAAAGLGAFAGEVRRLGERIRFRAALPVAPEPAETPLSAHQYEQAIDEIGRG